MHLMHSNLGLAIVAYMYMYNVCLHYTYVGDCNGRGQRYGNNSEACVCDTPYNGTQCERCADGFYGDQT